MATRQQFIEGIIADWENHSVYVGTGNGELVESLTIGKLKRMEVDYGYDKATTNRNIRRDLTFIGKCYEQGFDMSKASAEDCSGLPVHVLRDLEVIKPTADYNCRTFQEACQEVALKDLQSGDFVFNAKMTWDEKKKKFKSTASHMGVYIGDGYVIESRGRDYGVVKRKTSEGGWVVGGRLDWFSDDIPVLTRNLRYIKDNMMKGEDVKQAQERLNIKGCDAGVEDGIFGVKTMDATIEFQAENDLYVDGIIGQKTWKKLFTS